MSEKKEPYLDAKPQVDIINMTLGEIAEKTRRAGIEGMGETRLEAMYKSFEDTLDSQTKGDHEKMENVVAIMAATDRDERNRAMAFLWIVRHSERLRNMTLRELAHLMANYTDRDPDNFRSK